jgi:tetratricopeptide (TPR) repeat protein
MSQLGDRLPARLAALTQKAQEMFGQAAAADDLKGITQAVSLFEDIADISRREHPAEHWIAVVNLAAALIAQAEAGGPDSLLDSALDVLERHPAIFAAGRMHASYLEKKGQAQLTKAKRTGSKSVMREAVRTRKKRVELTPRGYPGHDAAMADLGITLLHSGAMFRSLADLDEAVAVLQAVKKSPDGSADRAAVLSALGNARLERFLRDAKRNQGELAIALADHQEAVDELSPGNINALTLESDFASALMRVHEKTGDRRALDMSVDTLRRVVDLTPKGSVRRAELLNNLVSVLLKQYESYGDPAILDEAIWTGRDAVAATKPGHIQLASCLDGLAKGLFRRGELRGTLLDLDEAAVLSGQAVRATSPGHSYLPMRLALHAQVLLNYLPSTPKLEDAARDLGYAASLMRHDDPERAVIEANHGAILEVLANAHGDQGAQLQLAVEAVRLTRKAADSTPPGNSQYPIRLLNFVVASATLARLSHDVAVLGDPLRRCESFNGQERADSQAAMVAAGFASALTVRHELTGDPAAMPAAIAAYQRAAVDTRLSVFRRLHAAQVGAVLASRCDETGLSLGLYALAIELLDSAAWRGMERRDQERMLAQYAGLPSDAAAMAITAGEPETAVEFLERGRGVLLDRQFDDSADLARLHQASPELAKKFENLRRELDSIVIPDLEADELDIPNRPPDQESEADQRSALARQIDNLIADIRKLPGCADLFRSPAFPALIQETGRRLIVIVNISDYRCDALIVSETGVAVTELPALTKPEVEEAATFFRTRAVKAFRSGRVSQAARGEMIDKLKWLWDSVADPILRSLGISTSDAIEKRRPKIYWCPTGPAAFLPLHAAGCHGDSASTTQLTVMDRAASVYIPKLRVLAAGFADKPVLTEDLQKPLIVSMPETPGQPLLPSAQEEADHLEGLFPEGTPLIGPTATREAVLTCMKTHSWFHFCVHGVTDDHTPVNGGLELIDGRLTIRHLMNLRLPAARFAFLGACATHYGAADVPDENVTISTALCISGCQHVVATLWPVGDRQAADFSRRVYGQLADLSDARPTLHPEDTAEGVRAAACAVRDAYPGQPERWVPFVCTSFN